ncbi:MAG: response regulator [Deltaproteobacteria bacterium]
MASRYVLVVEDDADVRGMVVDYLRRSCPDVREACDGAEALAILEAAGPPSVVLTDIVMPGVLGTTVAEYLRVAGAASVPLAFVTGSPEMAPEGGTVFPKPAKLQALRDFVISHMKPLRA